MIPELSSVYGLTPDDVWSLSQAQYAEYIRHHAEIVKESRRGQ